ncbi:hypothetical protein [Halomonas salipaludis]|uniref:hypothetical protein n=1 Tax=Halomonas salipaludis TaxID=2032625 RepID=UPI0011410969|nr:hypothetical protein [Halomonas salipaludis]
MSHYRFTADAATVTAYAECRAIRRHVVAATQCCSDPAVYAPTRPLRSGRFRFSMPRSHALEITP